MDERDSEECTNCGQRKAGGVIFHLLYCYDVYIMSAPSPQNPKQRKIDEYITQNILNPLEQHEYLCYHGCRNVCGGDVIISAMSKPTTIIPTTIVPVYRDKGFSSLQNFVLRPDYLDRTVFLFFDSTKIYPHAVSKNCFSICVDDPHLLRKLMETIDVNRKKNPLELRKRKLETQNDPESTMSSASEVQSYNPFRRSDRSRISFRGRPKAFTQFKDEVLLEDIKNLASPNGLLNHCHDPDEKKRHFAAKLLIKVIQKDMMIFCRNPDLQTFETTTGFLLQKQYTYNSEMYSNFEKLYCWILAAIFIRIYKFNDVSLKDHVKSLALKKYKASQNQFDQFCQKTYHKLAVSMHSKIKKNWPSLDGNESHIKKLEHYLSFVDGKMSTTDGGASEIDNMIGYFIRLPWDIRHIFLVIITEKIIEKKCMASAVSFFKEISTSVGKKHWEIFLDVVERATEHIQENYTKGTVDACLRLLQKMWSLQNEKRSKNNKLMTILKHFFQTLVYHPLSDVRNCITPLLFCEDWNPIEINQLGSRCIKVDEDLVETCIREKLSISYPDMTITELVQKNGNTLIFDATTPAGDTSVYLFNQKTLNDILQTNSTDYAHESFQEMSRAVMKCQGNDDYIVGSQNKPLDGRLQCYMIERGKPLLHFLHEKENQLTWSHMIDILIHITKAVQHCHNNCVLLRDITPASFMVFTKLDGSFQTKLSSFLYAKCFLHEGEAIDPTVQYEESLNSQCFLGDGKEPIAAYFSAPASLKNNMFTVFTDIWMLAATFYSILLYGRQPFEELAHLNVLEFVKEITTYHKAENPNSLPTDLWKIIELNLNSENTNRTSAENILQELDTYKDNLGDKKDTLYTVESICHPQNPGDIQRGYLDLNGNFKQDVINEPPESMYIDDFRQKGGQLHEIVSVRMSLNIRRKIKALFHENVLGTETILNGSYTTTLVSYPFSTYSTTLDKINTNVDLYRFLSYLEQITSALHYLHSQNILHCDLRCCYIYVNHHQDKLKVAHFGRAVSLEGKQTHLYKMMPSDAVKWSAPEVRSSGRYSKPSDIFNLAVVFLEAICTQDNIISSNHPLKRFTKFCYMMEIHATKPINITDRWGGRLNKLMQECWNQNPTKRPSLDAIKDTLEQLKAYDEFCSDSSEVEIEMEEEQQEATPGSAVEGSQASGMGNDYENYDTLPTRPLPGIPSLLPRQSFLLPYSTTQPREDVPEDHPYDLVYEQRDASTMDLKDHWQRNVVYPLLSQERVINNTTRCISTEETSDYEDVGIN
ncbi:hypothetical protein FKM82_015121 [Ascaphus truei]